MTQISLYEYTLTEQQVLKLQQGCQQIAPSWPLDKWIAVNPCWKMHEQPLSEVSAKLKVLAGAQCVMSKSYYLQRWQTQISEENLTKAITESGLKISVADALAHLKTDDSYHSFLAFSRLLDLRRHPLRQISWHDEIIHQISQTVASFALRMEQGETDQQTLYQYWLDHAVHDRGIAIIMSAPDLTKVFSELPRDPKVMLAMALNDMQISDVELANFAHAMLLDINGWASWAAYNLWMKTDVNSDNDLLLQLIAIRTAWEWVLYRYITSQEAHRYDELIERFHQQFDPLQSMMENVAKVQQLDWVWQQAAEFSYQQLLFSVLRQPEAGVIDNPNNTNNSTQLQAIFCIDVRSEVYRRALEAQHPTIETKGFAGFFGLPLSFSPADNHFNQPQLPGLLSASLELKQRKPAKSFVRNLSQSWQTFSSSSVSMFNAVEASGWFYGFKMIKNTWFAGKPSRAVNDSFNQSSWELTKNGQPLSISDKVELAHSILIAMGLTQHFAATILLVGHGSQSCNNHFQAALDCGACCGQTGEVNVRLLADILNDPEVRAGLTGKGLLIPDRSNFLAALHNTTTDDVQLFDSQNPLAAEQQLWLKNASTCARAERSERLSNNNSADKSVVQRSRDWAELRPEWGLANNASFIVAERRYTKGCNLQGRSFLHDYDWQNDTDYRILELILTAPMIVAHWINFQYYASVTDNHLYGSGDKTLHNIVAEHLGVFEGNGGDLRIGLPMQSLHNGTQWMHEPLRLTVVVNAPHTAIETIVKRHNTVQQLVDNQWLYLYAWQPENGQIQRLLKGQWTNA